LEKNVLFIVIDSMRSDKFFGEKKTSKTPNIDFLIKKGTLFTTTIPCAPSTIPSISSILVSKFPFESMVKQDDLFTLNPNIPNYLEKFQKKGYNIYSNNPKLVKYLGLDNICKCPFNVYENSKSLNLKLGDDLLNQISTNNLEQPWFYYLHTYDLHEAESLEVLKLKNPKLHQDEYGGNQYERIVSTIDEWIGKILKRIDLENTLVVITADHGTNRGRYTLEQENYIGEFNNFKNKISTSSNFSKKLFSYSPKFIKNLKNKTKKKYLENRKKEKISLNQIEIDKIELSNYSIFEKRLLKNSINSISNIYDDRFIVPLLFCGSNISQNKLIRKQVQSIDIMPTITDCLNYNDFNLDIRGKSLLPFISGDEFTENPAFIESAVNSAKMETEDVVGLRTSKYKYFRDRYFPNKKIHLYDLVNDSLEENNIAIENPLIVKKFEHELMKYYGETGFVCKELEVFSDDEEKEAKTALDEMGYNT
jgi:arylsulfatase A-like enzyme